MPFGSNVEIQVTPTLIRRYQPNETFYSSLHPLAAPADVAKMAKEEEAEVQSSHQHIMEEDRMNVIITRQLGALEGRLDR
jgi:hypothetical protein